MLIQIRKKNKQCEVLCKNLITINFKALTILIPRHLTLKVNMNADTIESFVNSKILINYFHELCKDFSPPYREECKYVNFGKFAKSNDLLHLLSEIKRLVNEGKCDEKTFKNEIIKSKTLSIEVIWYLEVAGITTIEEFTRFHEVSNRDVIGRLSQEIYNRVLEYNFKETMRKKVLVSWLKTVLVNWKNKSSETLSWSLLNLITTNLQASFQYNETEILDEKHFKLSNILELLVEEQVDKDILKLFCIEILNSLLLGEEKSRKFKFKLQEKIKNNVNKNKNFKCYENLSQYLEINDLMNVLKAIVFNKCEIIDWNNMLPFLTFLGTHFKDGWNHIKTLANLTVRESFKSFNSFLLEFGFLAARQGAFEKSNCFPSYLQWFPSMFSTNLKIINTKKISNFFFSFLTELVSYDAPYYLKVHINRSPWVPADCQSFLFEYVQLVKCQMDSLDVSVELGICENMSGKSTAECDVENVLNHFERTNEVPLTVFQAAMFSKDYYEKKFLCELLSKFEGKKSTRHKVIMKLHSAKKIPNFMFKSYKNLESKR